MVTIIENVHEGISDCAKDQATELLKKHNKGFDYVAGVLGTNPDEARELWGSEQVPLDTSFKVIGSFGVAVTLIIEEIK